MHIYKGTTGSSCFILRENDTLSGEKLVRLSCAYLDGNNWALVFYLKRNVYTFRGEINEIAMCISIRELLGPCVLS